MLQSSMSARLRFSAPAKANHPERNVGVRQYPRTLSAGCHGCLMRRRRLPMVVLSQFQSTDLVAMHLVGAIGEAQRARVCVRVGKTEVVGDTAPAVRLDGPVDDF